MGGLEARRHVKVRHGAQLAEEQILGRGSSLGAIDSIDDSSKFVACQEGMQLPLPCCGC